MYFSFGLPTYLTLLLIANWLAVILRNYLKTIAIKDKLHIPILTLLMMLGEMLGGFALYLYEKRLRNKRDTLRLLKIKKQFSLVLNIPKHQKNTLRIYLVIFGLAGIDTFVMFSGYLITISNASFNDFILKELILVLNTVFSFFILKIKIFRHHWSGIMITMAGFFFANLFDIVSNRHFNGYSFLYVLITALVYSLFEVHQKQLMDLKFIRPSRVLFLLGLFGLLILVLVCGVFNIIYLINQENFSSIKEEFDLMVKLFDSVPIFFSGVGFLLLSSIVNIGFVLINYYYNPISRIMTDINTFFVLWVVTISQSDNPKVGFIILTVVGVLILLFGTLLYHEMVIIHLFECDIFTKAEITNRGDKDIQIAIIDLEEVNDNEI